MAMQKGKLPPWLLNKGKGNINESKKAALQRRLDKESKSEDKSKTEESDQRVR